MFKIYFPKQHKGCQFISQNKYIIDAFHTGLQTSGFMAQLGNTTFSPLPLSIWKVQKTKCNACYKDCIEKDMSIKKQKGVPYKYVERQLRLTQCSMCNTQ